MTEQSSRKVLFTSHVANFQKFNRPFMRMFSKKGYEVHYASMGEEEILDCDKSFVVPFSRNPLSPRNVKAYRQLKEIIDKGHYDVIHTHTPMGSVVTRLAAVAARREKTRVIYTAHGFHFFRGASLLNWIIYYPVERYMARHTDTLITINNEDFIRAKKKFKTDVLYVPGVGVDSSKFGIKISKKEKSAIRNSLGLKDSDFIMIYVAELSTRKNQIWLVKTLEKFLKEHPEIHLLLVGRDSLNGKLHLLVDKLGLQSQISILGSRKDIPLLMKISNLAISTSRQEGLPVNIMEAISVGLPIVATDCRGNRELVQSSKFGKIVAQGDSEGFIQALDLSSKIDKSAWTNTILPYDLRAVSKKMEEIYFGDLE